jgi:hypothetical protein
VYKLKAYKGEVRNIYDLLATHRGLGGLEHVILSCNEIAGWWVILLRFQYRRLYNIEW